jgi:hypothetical protein
MVPNAPFWLGYDGLDAKETGHADRSKDALGCCSEQMAAAACSETLGNFGPWQRTTGGVEE